MSSLVDCANNNALAWCVAKAEFIENGDNLENREGIWLYLYCVCDILANSDHICHLISFWFMDNLHCDTEDSFGVCSNWSKNGLSKILCEFEHIELGLNIFGSSFLSTLNNSMEVNSSYNLIDMDTNFLNIWIRVNVFIYFHLFFRKCFL